MSDASGGPGWWQASDGKWYPPESAPGAASVPPAGTMPGMAPGAIPPGAPGAVPKQGMNGCLKAFLIVAALGVVGVIALVALVSAGAKKVSNVATDLRNNNPSGPGATVTTPAHVYALGESAQTSNWGVIAYAKRDPQPPANEFSTPSSGNHFVAVDVQVTNNSTHQETFSSALFFHLLDSANHQFDEEMAAGVSPGPPEGTIAAGQAVRGWVVFQIPDGTTGLKLRVQGSITAAGAVFALS